MIGLTTGRDWLAEKEGSLKFSLHRGTPKRLPKTPSSRGDFTSPGLFQHVRSSPMLDGHQKKNRKDLRKLEKQRLQRAQRGRNELNRKKGPGGKGEMASRRARATREGKDKWGLRARNKTLHFKEQRKKKSRTWRIRQAGRPKKEYIVLVKIRCFTPLCNISQTKGCSKKRKRKKKNLPRPTRSDTR